MERKKFKLYGLVITIVVGFVIGLSAFRGEPITAVVAVVVGMILLYALKSRVKQVIEDERVYRISEKASRRTIQVVGTTTALIGLSILGLSKSGYLELVEVGYSLAGFATVLLMVYMIFYGYYAKKFGE
jgi:uncharacterized membrane protein